MSLAEVQGDVDRYLRLADRLLPGRIAGFYVVGSAAAHAFQPGRSDIDFVAVVRGEMTSEELRRLRTLHVVSGGLSGLVSLRRGWSPMVNTCNGVFVREEDLTKPVSRITPIASHTGRKFVVARGFDVNPVMWKQLAERGIPVRGPSPEALGLQPQPELLRDWCLQNLTSYWSSWAEAALAGRSHSGRFRPRWATAWATLGAPRLHCTIATGQIISKQEAGEYALETFDSHWHPAIAEGLAYWRGQQRRTGPRQARACSRTAAAFVLEVVRSAHEL